MLRLKRLIIREDYQKACGLKSSFLLLPLLLLGGCPSDPDESAEDRFSRKLTVVVTEASIYHRPDGLSRTLGKVKFGQEVLAREPKSLNTPDGWDEIQLGPEESGYVRLSAVGSEELLGKLQALMKSVEGIESQASGVTTAATFLRLEPGRDGQGLEKLPSGTRFEMFERRAVLKAPPAQPTAAPQTPTPRPTADPRSKKTPVAEPAVPEAKKEIWYKVRLEDGRVGYIYTGNLKFQPPPDIEQYTRYRRAVAWHRLRTADAGALGQVGEYLVAYASTGVDFGADFNRIEIYAWIDSGYGTLFSKSELRGILPITFQREGEDIYFDLREVDPKQPGKLIVRRFHFPHPLKEVSKTILDKDVGLH